MTSQTNRIPFAEVVQAGAAEVSGQCRSGFGSPDFGSLILSGASHACVGVVYNVESVSLEPNRRPSALGLSQEELRRLHPQLSVLLREQFQALLIGTFDGNGFRYGLPARPPSLHSEIFLCEEDDIRVLGAEPTFLRLLYASNKPHTEELMLAVCKTLIESYGWRQEETVRIGKAVSEIYRDDYETLRRILSRMEAWLKT